MLPRTEVQSRLSSALSQVAQALKAERACVLTASGIEVQVPSGAEFPYSRRVVDQAIDQNRALISADAVTDWAQPRFRVILILLTARHGSGMEKPP